MCRCPTRRGRRTQVAKARWRGAMRVARIWRARCSQPACFRVSGRASSKPTFLRLGAPHYAAAVNVETNGLYVGTLGIGNAGAASAVPNAPFAPCGPSGVRSQNGQIQTVTTIAQVSRILVILARTRPGRARTASARFREQGGAASRNSACRPRRGGATPPLRPACPPSGGGLRAADFQPLFERGQTADSPSAQNSFISRDPYSTAGCVRGRRGCCFASGIHRWEAPHGHHRHPRPRTADRNAAARGHRPSRRTSRGRRSRPSSSRSSWR